MLTKGARIVAGVLTKLPLKLPRLHHYFDNASETIKLTLGSINSVVGNVLWGDIS